MEAIDSQLTERQRLILAMLIQDYVRTAQPVASGALVRQHGLGVSTATVRHELASLEALGLLEQPHTSAGRVPTVAGYRYFVEHLMRSAVLSPEERRMIRHQFHQAGWDGEHWMSLSAAVVARISGAAGLVAEASGAGRPRLYHAGLVEILYVPEFADSDRLRGVVELLEYGHGLEPIIDRLPETGVQVIIGGEPLLERTPYLTLVLARFGRPPGFSGVLGVVGPTRLAYQRAVSTVGFVSGLMNQLIASQAV